MPPKCGIFTIIRTTTLCLQVHVHVQTKQIEQKCADMCRQSTYFEHNTTGKMGGGVAGQCSIPMILSSVSYTQFFPHQHL